MGPLRKRFVNCQFVLAVYLYILAIFPIPSQCAAWLLWLIMDINTFLSMKHTCDFYLKH